MHSSHFMFLKNDPDFHTFAKLGRAINCLTCELVNVETYKPQRTVVQTRQFRHSGVALGGYMHETVQLVDRLKGRYLGHPAFEPLRVLVVEAEHRSFRHFLSTVRNCLAFHLDQTDEVTTRTATGMKPGNHTVMCGDGTSNADYYFEFADYIDMAFLMDENPLEHSLKETADAVVNMLASRAVDLLTAVHTFQNHLWKTTAKEHVY